ncbi:hypothetical protein BN439_pEA290041 (plasmid) [Erwinia amylovora Ea644]|nr:hypothetical protein BN439_pEA290041 [Erwinia amylovora Ea644]
MRVEAIFLAITKRAMTGCKFFLSSSTARIVAYAAKSSGEGVTGIHTRSLTMTAAEVMAAAPSVTT